MAKRKEITGYRLPGQERQDFDCYIRNQREAREYIRYKLGDVKRLPPGVEILYEPFWGTCMVYGDFNVPRQIPNGDPINFVFFRWERNVEYEPRWYQDLLPAFRETIRRFVPSFTWKDGYVNPIHTWDTKIPMRFTWNPKTKRFAIEAPYRGSYT